jgi:hypothetical protein
MSFRTRLLAFSLLMQAPLALACGYCVEDKIAATYDHAVVTSALAKHHHVVFFHVEGSLPAGEAGRRLLERAAAGTLGVDAGTVRVSADNLTLSFAFDPVHAPLVGVQGRVEKKLAGKASLMPLRVMERAADLKTVSR